MKRPVTRYHPLLAALHWLTALLVFANLVAGAFVLRPMPNTPDKYGLLQAHMLIGILVLILMVVRLPTRLFTAKPAVPHDSRALRWLAVLNHWLLYLVVLSMVSTGFGIAAFAKLWPLLRGQPVPLPTDFGKLEPFVGHAFFATALTALLALHVAGVLYHRLAHGLNILPRMGFGPRTLEDGR